MASHAHELLSREKIQNTSPRTSIRHKVLYMWVDDTTAVAALAGSVACTVHYTMLHTLYDVAMHRMMFVYVCTVPCIAFDFIRIDGFCSMFFFFLSVSLCWCVGSFAAHARAR